MALPSAQYLFSLYMSMVVCFWNGHICVIHTQRCISSPDVASDIHLESPHECHISTKRWISQHPHQILFLPLWFPNLEAAWLLFTLISIMSLPAEGSRCLESFIKALDFGSCSSHDTFPPASQDTSFSFCYCCCWVLLFVFIKILVAWCTNSSTLKGN